MSEEALKWMPKQQKDKEHVFHQLQITSTTVEVILGEWMKEAGIEKHITYHCSRHTAATMLLTLGADLYTVRKILGHSGMKHRRSRPSASYALQTSRVRRGRSIRRRTPSTLHGWNGATSISGGRRIAATAGRCCSTRVWCANA